MGLKSRDNFITMTYFNSVGWLLLLLHNLQSPVQTEYNRNKVIDAKFTSRSHLKFLLKAEGMFIMYKI